MSQCAQSLEWESSNALKKASGIEQTRFHLLGSHGSTARSCTKAEAKPGVWGHFVPRKAKENTYCLIVYVWKGTSDTDRPHVFWIPYQLYLRNIQYTEKVCLQYILCIYRTYYIWYSFIIMVDILEIYVCGHSPFSRDVHARRHANSFRVVSKGRAWTPWALGTLTRVKVNNVVK